jgi:hypothetical protein
MGKDTNMYISTFKQIVVDEDEKNNGEIQKVKQQLRFIDSLKYTNSSLLKHSRENKTRGFQEH